MNSFTYYHLLCGSGGGTASCSANAPSGARAARLVSRLHSFFFTGGILNKKWMQHSLLRGIIYIYDIDITFICNTVHVIYIYIYIWCSVAHPPPPPPLWMGHGPPPPLWLWGCGGALLVSDAADFLWFLVPPPPLWMCGWVMVVVAVLEVCI